MEADLPEAPGAELFHPYLWGGGGAPWRWLEGLAVHRELGACGRRRVS